MRRSRMALAMTILGTSVAFTFVTAGPASACTGAPCDAFCAAYVKLPPAVQQQVFHSTSCPIR